MRAQIANLDELLRQWMIMAVQIRNEAKPAKIEMLKENLDFKFPKIYFLEHLAEHISSYSYLGHY